MSNDFDRAESTTPQRSTQSTSEQSSRSNVQLKRKSYGEQVASLSPEQGGYESQRAALSPTTGPVQFQGDGGGEDDVHSVAAQGVAGSGGALPHLDKIQASFGSHDVTDVQAYSGAAAAKANESLGSSAYATGNKVALKGSTGLHTAAHEAAHIVQQRAGVSVSGGVGQTGDKYEQHADAVADAVVQGKSAESLLDTMAGGAKGTESVQRKEDGESVQLKEDGEQIQASNTTGGGGGLAARARNAAATGAGAAGAAQHCETATGATAPKHYKVEYKAWIPHAKVVDPEEKIRISDWFDTITDLVPDISPVDVEYEYRSFYHGDGHAGYDGSHRVLSWCEFDWDGARITNFQHHQDIGRTTRLYDWDAWLEAWIVGRFTTISKGSNSESDRASGTTSGSGSGSSFNLGMSSANPLVMGPAPSIDGSAVGQFTGNTLNLSYSTDMFPSHGIRVFENGATVSTRVINNAAGVPGLGVRGAAAIGIRLSLQANSGNYNV
jgi:hypothetical protein